MTERRVMTLLGNCKKNEKSGRRVSIYLMASSYLGDVSLLTVPLMLTGSVQLSYFTISDYQRWLQ